MEMQPFESTLRLHLLGSASAPQHLRASRHEYGASLSCVAQYPLGQVFVSSPCQLEDMTGGH